VSVLSEFAAVVIITNVTMYSDCALFSCSPAVSKAKLKEAHKRIMLLNHPDRGTTT